MPRASDYMKEENGVNEVIKDNKYYVKPDNPTESRLGLFYKTLEPLKPSCSIKEFEGLQNKMTQYAII
jgi:hypothetical protein